MVGEHREGIAAVLSARSTIRFARVPGAQRFKVFANRSTNIGRVQLFDLIRCRQRLEGGRQMGSAAFLWLIGKLFQPFDIPEQRKIGFIGTQQNVTA